MASRYYYFSGTANWAHLYKPDDKYKNWKIDLILDDKGLETFRKSELLLEIKEGDVKNPKTGKITHFEGPTITLRRPQEKLIKGEKVAFDPPTVLDEHGEPFKEQTLIGNGSKVTCKVIVYDTMKGPGHRLEAVRVDHLIPYEAKEKSVDEDTPF